MTEAPLRALVVTVVHHPLDARIRHRQIEALVGAGWAVTYAAPWSGYGLPTPGTGGGLEHVDLPRSSGRRRVASQLAVRRLLRAQGARHDVILLHDPELVPATIGLRLPPVVWDVHEDTAAALELREWLPKVLRGPAKGAVHTLERWAESRLSLLLADELYLERFRREHDVVPNTTTVPPEVSRAGVADEHGRHRVVYLGSLTVERGAAEIVELGRRLRARTAGRVVLQVIGPAHGEAVDLLRPAHESGDLEWFGFLPNADALQKVEGALAGLSLLHDVANFRPSMPTKVIEYMARGVPVISTPLPLPSGVLCRNGGGAVVPFGDVDAVEAQVLAWHHAPEEAARIGALGHRDAQERFDWARSGPAFVAAVEKLARAPRRRSGRAPAPGSRSA